MNILFLSHRLPIAPDRGDRIRAWHILRLLKARGHRAHVVAVAHDRDELARAHELQAIADGWDCVLLPRRRNLLHAVAALPGRRPLTHVLLDSPELRSRLPAIVETLAPQVVYAYCSGLAPFAFLPSLASVPCILDLVDVDSAKWHDLAKSTRSPLRFVYRREATRLRAFEREAIASAAATLVVTERERRVLRATVSDTDVEVVRNGIDVESFRAPSAPARDKLVVFTGVFNYSPNEEGALWFLEEIWPRVHQRHADASLALVGANPTKRLRRAATRAHRVTVTGYVVDVRTWLWRAAVGVAPLRYSRGIQNKVLEAVAAGVPVVVTPAVADGLPSDVLSACATAASAADFASQVSDRLAWSPESRRDLANTAHLDGLTWDQTLAPLFSLLERTAAASQPPQSHTERR